MADILYHPDKLKQFNNKFLIIDTCVLIELARLPELQQVFTDISSEGCLLVTTTDAYGEFLRGAERWDVRMRYLELFRNLRIAVFQGADQFCITTAGAKFQFALHEISKKESSERKLLARDCPTCKPSLVDERLLFLNTIILQNRHAVLVTLNFKDVPLKLFKNITAITILDGTGMHSVGFYEADMNAIHKAMASIGSKKK